MLSESVLGIVPTLPRVVADRRRRALEGLNAALLAVDPEALVRGLAGDRPELEGCTLFAFGKAALAMTRGLCAVRTPTSGLVVSPSLQSAFTQRPSSSALVYREGEHPLPSLDADQTGRLALELALGLGSGDLALCLVSGGGSSLLELPQPGISMAAIRDSTLRLQNEHTPIVELNRCRREWSQLKGGQLADAMAPARVLNLILSDIPGSDPGWVASGPTVSRGTEELVLADNSTAQLATGFERLGADGLPGEAAVKGEAAAAGRRFYRGALSLAAAPGTSGYVGGGETTVRVKGAGRGGRNQEFVLGALANGYRGGLLLSFGTDGVDGRSRHAGAFLDEVVAARAEALGLEPAAALAANDSEAFWASCGGAIETGPTGTNVADLVLYLP